MWHKLGTIEAEKLLENTWVWAYTTTEGVRPYYSEPNNYIDFVEKLRDLGVTHVKEMEFPAKPLPEIRVGDIVRIDGSITEVAAVDKDLIKNPCNHAWHISKVQKVYREVK